MRLAEGNLIFTSDVRDSSYGMSLSESNNLIVLDSSSELSVEKQQLNKVVLSSQQPRIKLRLWNYYQEEKLLVQFGLSSRIEGLFSFLEHKQIKRQNPAEIREYLTYNTGLIDISGLICSKVFERFGENSQITLELYKDPEIDDEYLTIYVRQDSYDDDIMARIEEISSEFDEELADCSGWLLITTDFKTPL